MRPKVVILILVAAFGLLGMVAVLKGLAGKPAVDSGAQTPRPGETAEATSSTTSSAAKAPVTQALPAASNVAVDPEVRAAILAKEQERMDQMVSEADGTNNSVIISALVEKVENPDADIRKAALAALVQLNDTNAVASLKQAEDQVTDPRGKVAIMDTIDYLNLPEAIPAAPPGWTNHVGGPIPQNLRMNPAFMHTNTAYLGTPTTAQ